MSEFHDAMEEAIRDWYRDELKRADARIRELEEARDGLNEFIEMILFGAGHDG